MSQEVIDRVKQRLIEGSLTKEQAKQVLLSLEQPEPSVEVEQHPRVQQRAQQAERAAQPTTPEQTPGTLITELASGLNRSVLETVDLLPRAIEEVAALSGVEIDLPTIQEATNLIQQKGAFAGEGLGTDIAAGIGELAPAALGGAAALRQAGARVGGALAGESVGKGVTRELGKTTGAIESGALVGGVAGEEIGHRSGGDVGGAVGGVAGALSGGVLAQQAVKAGLKAIQKPAADYISSPPKVDKPAKVFERQVTKDLREALNEGSAEAVGYKLVGDKVVKDQIQRNLVKEGLDERAIVRLANFNQQEKVAAKKMLNKASKFIKGLKGSERDRPQSVIGGSAMERINHLSNIQKKIGADIGKATQDLKGQNVDIKTLTDDFADSLANDLNININEKGLLDFKESIVTGPTKGIRQAFNMTKKGTYDAENLHRVKQSLSNLIEYDKPLTGEPIDARVKESLKALRAGINSKLRDLSPDYAESNDKFAEIAEVTKPFIKALGKNYDPQSDQIGQYVGQELRTIITNYKKGTPLHEGLVNLDAMANLKGGKFKDDLTSLVMFNDELERMFGSFAPGSARGLTQQAAGVVAESVGGTSAQLARRGLEMVESVKFRSTTKDKIALIKDMEKLIEGAAK